MIVQSKIQIHPRAINFLIITFSYSKESTKNNQQTSTTILEYKEKVTIDKQQQQLQNRVYVFSISK